MILMIDNFDSFTFNIVDYYRGLGLEILVYRNNEITLSEIETLNPELIVLSPGPKDPNSAGITLEVIRHFAGKIPIFGVCLGCQSIAQAFGGKIIQADKMYHGKTSTMTHVGKGILHGVKSPMVQMRYHSLIVEPSTLPDCLEVTAQSDEGEIMALRHKDYPIEAVQFHPESVASVQGNIIMSNALDMKKRYDAMVETKEKVSSTLQVNDDVLFMNEMIELLLLKKDLNRAQATRMMHLFSDNAVSTERMALVLTALRMKGASPDEIAGIATAARERAVKLELTERMIYEQHTLTDIVGTGGDAQSTFNISTLSGIVAAGAGAKVAKHGNRAVSSKSGSADILEALGVSIDIPPEQMAQMLDEVGMCFMFAPLYHPSMKYVAPVRRELKIRTVFNILGPLVNPAHVPNIVLGVFSKDIMHTIADTLILLNIQRAMVVYSDKGVDEITLDGNTHVIEITGTHKKEYCINPMDLYPDFAVFKDEDVDAYIEGGDANYNAQLLENILKGSEGNIMQKRVIESILSLNAGAVLYISGKASNLSEGISMALESIHSKSAYEVLKKMRSCSLSPV